MDSISKAESLCDFCLTSKSKYCCSRCHRRYCSLDCFKSVGHMQCSEEFFKQCVTEELLSQQFDETSKQKILDILQKNSKEFLKDLIPEEENEEEEREELGTRFNDLDISDCPQLWNKLSESEKQEFKNLLKSGKIADFIELWTPWWMVSDNRPIHSLIKPLDETCATQSFLEAIQDSKFPDLATNIHKLNDLISKPVSPSVCPAVVNTLLSYCYICRLFNGEYDSIEAIQTFVSKCPQLSDNINCDDLSKSLEMSVQQIMVDQPSHLAIESLRDLKCLIEGPKLRTQSLEAPEYVLRALSDLIMILNKIKKNSSKQKRKDLKIELLTKKLEFFLSWSVVNGSALNDCIVQINLKIETMSLSEESHRLEQLGDDLRAKLMPKTIIEEIN